MWSWVCLCQNLARKLVVSRGIRDISSFRQLDYSCIIFCFLCMLYCVYFCGWFASGLSDATTLSITLSHITPLSDPASACSTVSSTFKTNLKPLEYNFVCDKKKIFPFLHDRGWYLFSPGNAPHLVTPQPKKSSEPKDSPPLKLHVIVSKLPSKYSHSLALLMPQDDPP